MEKRNHYVLLKVQVSINNTKIEFSLINTGLAMPEAVGQMGKTVAMESDKHLELTRCRK